jgi:hypothetical protein
VHRLAKLLKEYIRFCPAYAVNQTKRHWLYGSLEPMDRSAQPFEYVGMDLVTYLPETVEGYNALMTQTCLVSKAVNLTPG